MNGSHRFEQLLRRSMLIVMLGLLAACGNSSVPKTASAAAQAASDSLETSTASFLSQTNIVLPKRSQAITSIDTVSGCGAVPEGRIRLDGRDDDWLGQPTWIAGTGRYDHGEFVWTDYPFDDAGDGVFQYPGEGSALTASADGTGVPVANELMQRYGANAADVVEVRAKADASYVYLLVRLNFLNAADSTVIGLGFDTDQTATTGFSAWPLAANISSPAHGFEFFITAHGDCAELSTSIGDTSLAAAGGAIRVGTRDNIMEIAVPRTLFEGATKFDLTGGSGLWDSTAKTWMKVSTATAQGANNSATPRGKETASHPEVFNLLFRDDEPSINKNECATGDTTCRNASGRTYQTRNQVLALRSGTSGPYAVTLDVSRMLSSGADDPAPIRRGAEKYFNRVYRSRIDTEGITGSGNAAIYMSRYQPYMVYVPGCFETHCAQWANPARAPLALLLHGGGGDHTELAPKPSVPQGGELYGSLDLFDAFEEGAAPVVAILLGRGHQSPSWRGYGEVDVLEVLDDARRAYQTDRQRQTMIGASQGGYGALRVTGLYPDLWSNLWVACPVANEASGANEQGQVDPSLVTFVVDPMIRSLLNVPYRQSSGVLDPLAPITVDRRLRDYALSHGLAVKYTEYQTGSHCFDAGQAAYPYTNSEAPAVAPDMKTLRVVNPAQVRYSIDPRQYPQGGQANNLFDIRDAGVTYGGAYWVSGMQMRADAETLGTSGSAPGGTDESSFGKIDVVSHAIEGWQVQLSDCGSATGPDGGAPGSNPLTPTPTAYQCQQQTRGGALSRLLELAAQNLDTATLDLASANLTADFELSATGDGPLQLRLRNGSVATARGECVNSFSRQGSDLTLGLVLGQQPCSVQVSR